MKVLIAIFIFFSSLTLFSQSQYCTQDLYPMRGANKMMGYVNVQREWVVQPFFDKASSFTGNMALVQRKGKIGAINCDGKLILRCEYDEILPFLGGRAWFRKQTKWGLLNDKGTIIIEPKYEEIREIAKYTDQTWVRLNEKWGVVDKFKNEVIWECTFNTYNQTIDATHAFVTSERFNGLIRVDSKTKVVNDIIVLDDYLKRKYIVQLSSGKQGVIDYSGKIIINFDADSIIFSKQMYIVHNLGKSSLYNIQGKKIKNGFDDMKPFNNRFIAQVKKGGLVNFITRKGKVIFKHKYLSLEYCADHNNFVAQNEKGYFLVNNSEKVISPYFKRIKRGNGYFVGISNKNEQQLISTLGKVDENIFLDIKQEDTLTQIRVKSKTTAKS